MSEMLISGSNISHYRIASRIGAGGMGEVYLAEDTRLDRKVAVKLLPAEFTRDADRVRRFMQEAKAASALNHPNIITVYDIGESDNGRFIVMELVAGRTLSSIIAEGNSTAVGAGDAEEAQRGERLLSFGSQMAKALSAAHAAGITHRDIKPDNIMVRDDGYVKVLDFGLARLLPSASGEDAATVAQQTTPGMILGTVAYMSPEQARGQSAGPPSDVFALGIVLYELATGQHPFRAETLVGYLHAITLQTPPPPSRLRPGLPAALDELILRMLRKDANQRPAASEVAKALQEIERRGDTTKLPYVENETVLLPTAHVGATSADEGFWVAVLPFKWRGANADLEALAEGLTEDIVTGLSRFSYLRVIARSSTLRYASNSSDARAIGKEVGARYVMEGNLRQAGPILRVAVQLVDAETGAHLWAEAYDRPYSAEQIFSLQDDLVPRIVSTVADSYGILPHSMSQVVRSKPTEQLTPYEALLRSFSYVERVTSEEHASARAALERAVEQAPGDSDSWAMLSILHTDEHIHGFSARTGLLEQALQFARRAVDENPLNHRAHQALAWALCYRKEFDACKHAAERTVALNPMDASALAHVGQTIAYGGGWERGCELLNRAMQLNPHHPGWYRYALFLNAYRQADYSGALEIALKMSMPGVSLMYVALAAVYGQLSKLEAAREAIRELLVLRPNFKTEARTELEKLWDSVLVDRLIEGLHKAGLETVEAERVAARTLATDPGRKNQSAIQHTASSTMGIVVLPFTNTSADEENEYFCDGLTEELITDLSKIRSLRVISRNSAMRLKGTTKDLRTIVEELNVRYVLDGSVRKVGQSLRISVQLIDGVSDANLWSDKYNGTLEDIFEMQEKVSRSIADALEITLTDDEQRQIEERPIGNAQAYDLYLRARAKFLLGIPSALDRSIELLKQGLDIIGENDLLYAALGYTYYFYFRWISKLDEGHLRLANECTQKVFAINPSSSHGFSLKGLLCYSEGDIGESIRFLKKAVELEPTNTEALLWLAANNSYINHREEAMKYADKVRALDPLLPINTLIKGVVYLYDGQFNASLLWAERSLAMEPANLLLIWSVAIIKAWCGKIDEAITHIDTLAQIAPDWVYTQHGLFLKHGLRGEKDLALRYDTAELETEAQHDCHFGLHVAHCFALVGMNDRALDFLERAVRTGMVNSRFLGELDPLLENIRHEKRFKDLMLEAQRLFEQISDTKKNLESSQDNLVRKPAPGSKEQRPSETSPTSNSSFEEGFWVAVLPFKYSGANADLEALAEGLSEEIITGLSRFSYLRVVARSSTLRFTSEASDIRTIGIALGARYVMEGSVRQAGETVRLAVQLVDATNGAHLWAETFDRRFQPNQIFAMQDELIPRIVSTCADHFGVLARSISDAVRWKEPSQLSPYEALMRGFGYHLRLTASEHAEAREVLERAVQQAPGNADCWAMLSWIYSHEYGHGFNTQPGSLDRALEAARRAVDLAPSNHLAYQTLAVALFFRKDIAGCLSAAERALAINPLDASNEAIFLITFTGDWERGCSLISRAMDLNPHHPGWYRWVLAVNEYRKANYREAVDTAVKANAPGIFWTSMLLAAAYGQLGELDAAGDSVRNLLAQKEDFVEWARETLGKWFEPDLVEHLKSGLRKAGLEIGDQRQLEPARKERSKNERQSEGEPPLRNQQSAIQHTVGREPERHELRAAFSAAKAGRGSILCVAGEPGIGKTTLIEDFLAELSTDENATIARGRCSERLAGTEAYLPLLDALENLLQSDESVAPTMKQLAPTWYAQVVPLTGESDESARLLAEVKAASQERMKRELAALLQAVAQARPLVIFFDDLHWADISTIDLLNFLAGKFDALNLLIMVTYRPSDMLLAKHPFLQIKPDLQARGVCRELQLEFLNEAEITQYLALEFPGHHFPSEFRTLIHAKTEGSPLFVADLVRYLRDRGVIAQTSGTWMLARALPDIERELPESVRGMIERKIAQLSEEDHKLLTAASVQGYEFDSAVVAQVLSLDADEIEERLEKLERVFAFVKLTSETEFPNRTLTMRYRFIHVLYQNALYTSLRATRRAKLSREVAQTLESFYGERKAIIANELAALYETGREFAKAADYFHLAAEHAREVFAEQEAAALARRGVEALKSLPDTPERAQQELALQVTLGLALRTIKGFSNSETGEAYARARELCEQIGDAPQLFPVLFGLWEFDQSTAQLKTAVELAEKLIAAAGQNPSLLLVAHNVMADQLTWVGRFAEAREHLEQGIALYDIDQHRSNVFEYGYDSGVACLSFGSIVLWHLGYPDQALRMSDQACVLASRLSHPVNLAFAASFAAWFHSLVGSMQAALEQAEAGIALSEQYEIAMFLAWGKLMKGWALISQGTIEDGIAIASQGINEWRASGTLLSTSWCLGILAEGERRAGRAKESMTLLNEALDFASKNGEHFYEAELHRLRGELLLKSDDGHSASQAEQCFHQAIAIARQQSAKALELRAVMSLARLMQQRDKAAEARQMLAEIYGWFTEGFDTTDLQKAKGLLDELARAAG